MYHVLICMVYNMILLFSFTCSMLLFHMLSHFLLNWFDELIPVRCFTYLLFYNLYHIVMFIGCIVLLFNIVFCILCIMLFCCLLRHIMLCYVDLYVYIYYFNVILCEVWLYVVSFFLILIVYNIILPLYFTCFVLLFNMLWLT